MIKSFKHKGLKKFFESGSTAKIDAHHAAKLRLILSDLNSAHTVGDMDSPAYKLHALKGNRKNIYSVWINGYWRVTFEFYDGNAYILNYEDYH